MSEAAGDGWIGRPLKRREDHRLLTGAGCYVDDLRPPGCLHVALLRSPHAHAQRWASLIPNAVVELVPDAGHMLPYEQPQALVGAVSRFLG